MESREPIDWIRVMANMERSEKERLNMDRQEPKNKPILAAIVTYTIWAALFVAFSIYMYFRTHP